MCVYIKLYIYTYIYIYYIYTREREREKERERESEISCSLSFCSSGALIFRLLCLNELRASAFEDCVPKCKQPTGYSFPDTTVATVTKELSKSEVIMS